MHGGDSVKMNLSGRAGWRVHRILLRVRDDREAPFWGGLRSIDGYFNMFSK